MLSSSNFQLSLFLMSTKSYLKFRTIRVTPQKWVGFGKPLFKFGDGVSGPFIKERCRLSLELLEQNHDFAKLQEIKLAAC